MASSLPPDIILLICEELASRRDFATLFQCALAGKQLAGSAILSLYRIHTLTSIRGGESNEAEMSRTGDFQKTSFIARQAQQRRTVSKWAKQWRSIILSSLGKTAYPYSLYTRSLDLANLEDLLEDVVFRQVALQGAFFAGDMSIFLRTIETPRITRLKAKGQPAGPRINTSEVLDLVGESISKYVGDAADFARGAAALEDLRGGKASIDKTALPRWIGRLSRLKSMTIWDGSVLERHVGEAIKNHCPSFDTLTSFLVVLKPHTLRSLTILSAYDIDKQTLLALNNHSGSLSELVLGGLPAAAIKALEFIKDCTALRSLNLQDTDGLINLEATETESFQMVITWLTSCKNLQGVRFQNFVDGPAFLRSICLTNSIQLKTLSAVDYTLVNNQDFHRAIALQTSLESVELRADPEEATRDDIDILVSSLCALKSLSYLSLLDTSDYFAAGEVKRLADSLPELEEFSVGGYSMDDSIWPSLSKLHKLRICSFHAMTSFTFEGILAYINHLQPSNAGLLLSVMCATLDSQLSASEQTLLQDTIAEKVDGKFEFLLFREAGSESESDSE